MTNLLSKLAAAAEETADASNLRAAIRYAVNNKVQGIKAKPMSGMYCILEAILDSASTCVYTSSLMSSRIVGGIIDRTVLAPFKSPAVTAAIYAEMLDSVATFVSEELSAAIKPSSVKYGKLFPNGDIQEVMEKNDFHNMSADIHYAFDQLVSMWAKKNKLA
jgi:hypothetical protein